MPAASRAEVLGFTKLARMSPEELRALFMRSGTVQGGLRGALLGAGAAFYTRDPEDADIANNLSRVAAGGLVGGLGGALLGRLHGAHLAKVGPFQRTVQDDGTTMIHLRTPGTFGNELIYQSSPSRVHKPEVGSALLGDLLKARALPREAL